MSFDQSPAPGAPPVGRKQRLVEFPWRPPGDDADPTLVAATALKPLSAPPVEAPMPPVVPSLPPPPPMVDQRVGVPGRAVPNDRPPDPGYGPSIRDSVAVSAGSADGAVAVLEAEGVTCWFGSRVVLRDVNLSMMAGEITALIGPSGCGKSTFLRCLNRLHGRIPGAGVSGSIRLDGEDIYASGRPASETRVKVGMVFQRPNPFPAMTIAENVLAGLTLSGHRPPNRDDLVEECLRRAGLWNETRDRLSTSGAALSGGQQQRLCIARALAVRPRVLLMDEPCSALDPISTLVIEETMHAIKDDVTIVIVTHNMQQAARVSDRCALFLVDNEEDPGYIVESGSTAPMFSNPVDPRTADYVAGRFG